MPLSEVFIANLLLGLVLFLGLILGYIWGRSGRRGATPVVSVSLPPVRTGGSDTELKKITRELEAKNLELTLAYKRFQSLENAKAKFIAVSAHQLRTPLAAIKWTFNIMLSNEQAANLSPEQREVLTKGYQSSERMIAIVNELLTVDQLDGEQQEYKFTPIQLEELVESIMFEFTNQAESKKITLAVRKPPQPLPLVQADPLKLRMVLENLIDNAIKYNRYRGRVEVVLSDTKINSTRNSAEIIITDTGIGIPPADREKIFNKFFRAGNAVREEPNGSGLGLYLSKDIIERHGGTIWFETSDQGTTFHIELPLHQPR